MFRVGHLELFVREPLASIAFYRDRLGFEVETVQHDTFVWLTKGETVILLRPGSADAPPSRYADASTGIVLYTDDLTATMAELRARGLEFNGTDGSDACPTFVDPDGHWFQLVNPAGEH